MVRVDVEYCGSCGHYSRYLAMREVVLRRVPETKISGQKGRSGSFEVEVEKTLVHSKLLTNTFPDFDRIADIVERVANGGPVLPVSYSRSHNNCCIM